MTDDTRTVADELREFAARVRAEGHRFGHYGQADRLFDIADDIDGLAECHD